LQLSAFWLARPSPPSRTGLEREWQLLCGIDLLTCFSVDMSWAGNVVTLTATNLAGRGRPDQGDRSLQPSEDVAYTVSGQSGYGRARRRTTCRTFPAERGVCATNDQGSMPGDGESGHLDLHVHRASVEPAAEFDDFISGASVGAHFISGPNGCSTKPIINADGSHNSGPLDENCGGETTVLSRLR
jgi:hypothetical protein